MVWLATRRAASAAVASALFAPAAALMANSVASISAACRSLAATASVTFEVALSSNDCTWLNAVAAALSNTDAKLEFTWMDVLRPLAELEAAPKAIAASLAAALAIFCMASVVSSSRDAATALDATTDEFALAASRSKSASPILSKASAV